MHSEDPCVISIYLSPSNPRWTPKTEADLKAAITGGLIEEKHYFDAKEMLATKGDNKELARDLASFAIDGGTMIVGLAEDKQNSTFSRAPVAPAGATGEGRTGSPLHSRPASGHSHRPHQVGGRSRPGIPRHSHPSKPLDGGQGDPTETIHRTPHRPDVGGVTSFGYL
jgi:hypothetical protein